ncbi:MAG TPA: sigma-70 family RNA polymerase sigma factor [Caulobacteraceae bacterium]
MDEGRARIVAWVGREILPHEADVRAWLRRSLASEGEVEDIIQDAYCRLLSLGGTGHIASPRAYFFTAARAVALDRLRRSRIVRMEAVTEIENLNVVLDEPSPERVTAARRELERVRRLIAELPERCRRIFELRKIEGLSQREIARVMGVTETIVENDVVKGQRLILKAIAEGEMSPGRAAPPVESHERARDRRGD